MRLRGAAAPVGAEEVRLDDVVPAVVVTGLVRAADAGIRDQEVERLVDRRQHLLAVADVAGAHGRAGHDVLQPRHVAREQRQARALFGEALRDRAADARPCAGDDGVLAFESLHAGESTAVALRNVARSASAATTIVSTAAVCTVSTVASTARVS